LKKESQNWQLKMCKIKYESYVTNYVFLDLAKVMLESMYFFLKSDRNYVWWHIVIIYCYDKKKKKEKYKKKKIYKKRKKIRKRKNMKKDNAAYNFLVIAGHKPG